MLRPFLAAAPLAAAMIAAPALAQTGFNGFYDYSTWSSAETIGAPTVSAVDPTQQTLYLYEPDPNWDPWQPQEFTFSHAAGSTGTVSFDWTFDGSIDPCCSGLNFYVNDVLVANLAGGYWGDIYKWDANVVSGTFSIGVNAGDVLSFGAFSADGCCNASLSTITNFNAPAGAVPEPASWAMMVGGFGLVGGALRNRRKVAIRFA